MIKTWLEMKKKEILVKSKLYGMILAFADEQEEIIELVKNLYVALKDVPTDELRKEFVTKISELAHAEAVKQRKMENVV